MKMIIDELLPLTKKTAADWTPFFIRHNIEKDVQPLYDAYPKQTANVITAYIILAYFQTSPWVRNHKDRLENKLEILTTLTKIKTELSEPYLSLVQNTNVVANVVIDWALRFQQDWRIITIESYRGYHAHMLRMCVNLTEDVQRNINIGKGMEEATQKMKEADEMQKEVDSAFAALNTALVQEQRSKLSEIPSNQLTWEQHLTVRKEDAAIEETKL